MFLRRHPSNGGAVTIGHRDTTGSFPWSRSQIRCHRTGAALCLRDSTVMAATAASVCRYENDSSTSEPQANTEASSVPQRTTAQERRTADPLQHLVQQKQRHTGMVVMVFNKAMDQKFGFSSFAETWNGRLAMMGFIIGLGTELLTGQGILSQIGIA